ncbi:MAG TPA: hypothetical protein DDX40_01325 [Rikenellaceae bacterium]|nr:hypothetical protein [Rikenellaceae bacterium]
MKWFFKMMLPALVLVSCSKEGGSPVEVDPVSTNEKVEVVAHDKIELGRKLENPYSVANVGKALADLYPTRGGIDVPVTDYYVRFLPKDTVQFNILSDLGVEMLDHPMDCEIVKDGDYYHDPSVPEGEITWQYAVVPPDFVFPEGIRHEILEECFIPDDDVATRSLGDFDLDALERKAFELTDNSDLLEPVTRAKAKPSGKITIVDDRLRSKKTVGVAGVKMVANVFVKIATTYTDENGDYQFSRKFSAKPHYRICFKNSVGFSIGLNLILIPASISTIGKGSSTGIDLTIDKNSDATLFRRCVVNNAAYDYFKKCQTTGVAMPPKNLRFWILNILRPSSTLMMHHGALLDNKLVSKYIGKYTSIVRLFAPDITIGSKDKNGNYSGLYSTTIHEMAHASHFSKVGTDYWKKYATYILTSFVSTGDCYGVGGGEHAGCCEVGEMWAYYVENMMYKARYGVSPDFGFSYWFKPQIFMELENGGIKRADICASMNPYVTDIRSLKNALLENCSGKTALINKTFSKYSK